MFRFLCKAENFDEKQKLVKKLEEESIRYKVKSTGPNIFQKAGYENKCYWFRIYVDKADYTRASQLIDNM